MSLIQKAFFCLLQLKNTHILNITLKHSINPDDMKKQKIKIGQVTVKNFINTTKAAVKPKVKVNDGGYVWVG